MNLLRCSNGHYYDGDRYKDCPFCSGQNQAGDFDTVDFQPNDQGASVMTRRENSPADPPTQKKPAAPEQAADPLGGAIDIAQQGMTLSDDEGRTVSYYDRKIQEPVLGEPVVGWLVCTKGRYFGQSFALKSGRNFIGRSDSMDVILKGEPSVSRDRHAVVVYEPRERIFIAQPGDSGKARRLGQRRCCGSAHGQGAGGRGISGHRMPAPVVYKDICPVPV